MQNIESICEQYTIDTNKGLQEMRIVTTKNIILLYTTVLILFAVPGTNNFDLFLKLSVSYLNTAKKKSTWCERFSKLNQ